MENENLVLSKENTIFSLTKRSRYLPNAFLATLIAIVIMIVAELLTLPFGIIRDYIPTKGLNGEAFSFAINDLAIPFGASIMGFFLWVKIVEKRPIYSMGFEKKELLKKYLRGFVIGILMIGSCVAVFAALGMSTIDFSDSSTTGFNALGGILIVLIGWIIQGASEEIMVRGWLLPVIGRRHNVALAIFISSTLFGALHLFNDNIAFLPILNLILFGVFAALYVIWEGGLWGICALHSSWNWAQGNIFGFEVSGTLPVGGILLDFNPVSGHELMTGGSFGVEGGLVCTVQTLIGIIILLYLIKRK